MNNNFSCIQGSVKVAPSTTTETPFSLEHDCIRLRGGIFLYLKNGLFGKIVSDHDRIEIVESLNIAFQLGYTAGFKAPKFISND